MILTLFEIFFQEVQLFIVTTGGPFFNSVKDEPKLNQNKCLLNSPGMNNWQCHLPLMQYVYVMVNNREKEESHTNRLSVVASIYSSQWQWKGLYKLNMI